jgi:hypothetical protein
MFGPPRLDPDDQPLAGPWHLLQEPGAAADRRVWVLANRDTGHRIVLEPIRRPMDLLRAIRGLGYRAESEPAHDVVAALRALSIVFTPWETTWEDPIPDGAMARRCEQLHERRRQDAELHRRTQ